MFSSRVHIAPKLNVGYRANRSVSNRHNGTTHGGCSYPQTTLFAIASENLLLNIMDETPVAHNCGPTFTAEVMSPIHTPCGELSILINRIGTMTVSCYWKILGDEPNSMCKLLDIPWSDMRSILRKCKVLYGANDSFRVKKFEEMMLDIGCHWVAHRPQGRPEHCMRVGNNTEHVAADMHSLTGGNLEMHPSKGVHMPGVRTKMLKRLASKVLATCDPAPTPPSSAGMEEESTDTNNQSNKGSVTIYVNELLEVVGKEAMGHASLGDRYSFSQRSKRMLRKAIVHAVKGTSLAFVESWVERVGKETEGKAGECLSTPSLTRLQVTTMHELPESTHLFTETPTSARAQEPLVTPPVDLTVNNDEDE